MTLKIEKYLGALIAVCVLSACGGGSSGSDDGNNQSSEFTAAGTSAPTSGPDLTGTGALVANETFVFQSSFEVDVNIDVAPSFDYVTICYPSSNSLEANYSNCVLNADLLSGSYNGELLLTYQTKSLFITLWSYDDIDSSETTIWERDIDGEVISI